MKHPTPHAMPRAFVQTALLASTALFPPLLAESFSDWISSFPDLGIESGFNDDPDGDGNPNGVENYFGTDPNAFSTGVSILDVRDGTVTFSHPVNDTPAEHLVGAYLWSEDLLTFHPDGTGNGSGTSIDFVQETPVGGMMSVTANISGPMPPTLFIAISVDPPPPVSLDTLTFPNYISHRGASHLYPQQSLEAFDLAYQQGMPLLETDMFLLSDGGVALMHDQNEVLLDGAPTSLAALKTLTSLAWKERVTYNPAGYAGSPNNNLFGFSDEYPALTLKDLLHRFGNKVILMPEMKENGLADPVLALLEEHQIRKDMFMIQGGTGRYSELKKFAASGWTTMMHNITTNHAAYIAEGITWTATNSEADMAAAKAAGMKVAAGTQNFRFYVDRAFSWGADLIYTDQSLYISAHTKRHHRRTTDPFDLGIPYHGHEVSGPGTTVANGELRFNTQSAGTRRAVLQGWASPLVDPENWTMDYHVKFDSVLNDYGFVSLFVGEDDRSLAKVGSNAIGYDVVVRRDGRLQVYLFDGNAGGPTGLRGEHATIANLAFGQWYHFRLTVTPTSLILENMDLGTRVVVNDTHSRGQYIQVEAKECVAAAKDFSLSEGP